MNLLLIISYLEEILILINSISFFKMPALDTIRKNWCKRLHLN